MSPSPELNAAFDALVARSYLAAARIVTRSQVVVEANIKFMLSIKGHQRGTPTDSLPGEPPSTVSGALQGSVVSDRVVVSGLTGRWGGIATGHVYPSMIYARIQELGGNGLPARPYVQPGADMSRDAVSQIAIEEWGKSTKV